MTRRLAKCPTCRAVRSYEAELPVCHGIRTSEKPGEPIQGHHEDAVCIPLERPTVPDALFEMTTPPSGHVDLDQR